MSNIDTLNAAELKEQLEALEVEYNPKSNEQTLRKKLKEALGHKEITENSEGENQKSKFVEIKFDKDEKNKQPVYVGLNGRSYRFTRGLWAKCPRILLPTIENMEKTVLNEQTMELETIQSYSYQVREVA